MIHGPNCGMNNEHWTMNVMFACVNHFMNIFDCDLTKNKVKNDEEDKAGT